ncbi:MAG: DHHA1 domain-containing protein [bacterium]|nr:DHHA1 domain-containing protein [bacterium]
MEQQIKELKAHIESSKRILITSHISPDPDAVSSVLLLGTTFAHNYPNKEVAMALEEEPEGLDFLTGYSDIKFGPLPETINAVKPDLLVMLDAVNYERCSRAGGEQIRQYLSDNKVSTAIIDHHEPAGKDNTDVYIHQDSVATAQDVYEVCYDHIGLKRPNGYGETTMLGIYSDSGGFTYANRRHKEMFAIVNELIEGGVDLESIKNKLSRYSQPQMHALGEFAQNTSQADDYSYSFLGDKFVEKWLANDLPLVSLNTAAGLFVNDFIRSIDNRKWGFIVYRNPIAGKNMYSVSLRSQSDVKDVSKIANSLGGGGHKPAAGAKIEAKNIEEAIQKVQRSIKEI